MNIFFDQYQRYKNTQIIINSARKNGEKFNILEVGANEHKNLEKFLPDDNIKYLDIELSEELKKDPKYILGDATEMEFEDNSFDIIVALDVFEHIPPEKREAFLSEINRASSRLFIIAAPFFSEENALAEKRANQFYKIINGADHRWLIEHIENGLPVLSNALMFLDERNIKYETFNHGNVEIWEELMNIQYIADCKKDFFDYFWLLNEHYNKLVFKGDYCEKGYRTFIIGKKSDAEINIEKQDNSVQIKSFLSLIQNAFFALYNGYKTQQTDSRLTEIIEKMKKRPYLQVFGDADKQIGKLYYIGENEKSAKIYASYVDFETKHLRIDPLNESCVIKINSICVRYKDGQEEDIKDKVGTNGDYKINGNLYIITNSDPQIIYKSDKEIISAVIDIDILLIGLSAVEAFKKLYEDFLRKEQEQNEKFADMQQKLSADISELLATAGNLNNKIAEEERKINKLNEEIKEKNEQLNQKTEEINQKTEEINQKTLELSQRDEQINAIYNSTSWKITKPLRKMKGNK